MDQKQRSTGCLVLFKWFVCGHATLWSFLSQHGFQGRAVKFIQPKNKMSCAQRKKCFCSGVGQKSSQVGCSGVEIPCSGDEIGGYGPVKLLLNEFSITSRHLIAHL